MIEHHDISATGAAGQCTPPMLIRISEHQVICLYGDHAVLYERWVPSSRVSGWEYKRLEQTLQLSDAVAFSWHEAEHFWCDVDAINLERHKEILDASTEKTCKLDRLAPTEIAMERRIQDAGISLDPSQNRERIRSMVKQWATMPDSQLSHTAAAPGTVEAARQRSRTTEVKVPAVGDWHRAETLRLLRQWRGLARSGETLVDESCDRERTNGFGMPLDVVLVQIASGSLD